MDQGLGNPNWFLLPDEYGGSAYDSAVVRAAGKRHYGAFCRVILSGVSDLYRWRCVLVPALMLFSPASASRSSLRAADAPDAREQPGHRAIHPRRPFLKDN